MKLGCGKFDLSLRDSYSGLSLGFSSVEVDLTQFFRCTLSTQRFFLKWIEKHQFQIIPRLSIRIHREASEYEDLIRVWLERFGTHTHYFCVHSGRRAWDTELSLPELKKLPGDVNYFFEWGQDDRPIHTLYLQGLGCFGGFVLDPHWHSKYLSKVSKTPTHFKLHGWSEQRWVRRYGERASQKILKTVSSRRNASLVLAHSGRREEAMIFNRVSTPGGRMDFKGANSL